MLHIHYVKGLSSGNIKVPQISGGPAIHCGCGCDGLGHGHGSGTGSWSGVVNEICTSAVAAGCGHPVVSFLRTFPPECVFRSISIRPASGTRPPRPVCPRTLRRQNLADCGRPTRCAVGRTCRMHFRSRAWTRTSPGCRRKPCRPGPTRGSVPLLLLIEIVYWANF